MSGGGKVRGSSSSLTTYKTTTSSSARVSMPKKIQDMIQTIKEIAGSHTDEEIHAMLKECGMDPNEAAQKLLSQDPFHEVRRKRDKRKENLNNREPSDSRRTGTQGRGGRGGRENFPPRYTSDTGNGRNAGKENGLKQGPDRGALPSSLPASQEVESKALVSVPSSLSGVGDNPTYTANGRAKEVPIRSGVNAPKRITVIGSDDASFQPSSSIVAKTSSSEVNVSHEQPTPSSDNLASPVSVLGVYSSATDPVLVPSLESRLPGTVGTIKRQVGSQRPGIESNSAMLGESKSSAAQDTTNSFQINKVVSREITKPELSSSMNENKSLEAGNSIMHGKIASKSPTFERNQSSETSHYLSSSAHEGTSSSRPSSNYGSRSQQLIGSQKAVGSSKEWKPKSTNPTSTPASSIIVTMGEVGRNTVEARAPHSLPTLSTSVSEESTSKLQLKLDELRFSHNQHVIIPDHLHVPEAERTGLSFGSFDANFGLTRGFNNDPDTDKSSTPLSESSQEVEGPADEPCSSNQVESLTSPEEDYSGHQQSPKTVTDTLLLVEADVSSSAGHEYELSKPEIAVPLGGSQYSVVHPVPNYNFGFMPPILGTQFAPFDTSEPQARDASRLPSFVVQQPFDPSASYYTQFYRASGDGDGRFAAPGAANNKYNGGNIVVSEASGNSASQSTSTTSTTGPVAVGGVMQPQSQQPVAVFRQPSGVHLAAPHYPPNFIPTYSSQYFTPQFYMPPPQTIHHYLTTTNPAAAAFQQPTSVYPPPPPAAAGVKFSLSQFKPVTSNSSSVGYAAFNASPPTTEELSSHYKENVYITGGQQQQSEGGGSGVWIPAAGRDVLHPSSFYSLSPHQGQHVTFAASATPPTAFYHHHHPTTQTTMAIAAAAAAGGGGPIPQSQSGSSGVEMVNVYQQQQQPQRAQMNWTTNY